VRRGKLDPAVRRLAQAGRVLVRPAHLPVLSAQVDRHLGRSGTGRLSPHPLDRAEGGSREQPRPQRGQSHDYRPSPLSGITDVVEGGVGPHEGGSHHNHAPSPDEVNRRRHEAHVLTGLTARRDPDPRVFDESVVLRSPNVDGIEQRRRAGRR
jgi:hypothetical protein